MDTDAQETETSVVLTARTTTDGSRFVAAVEGLAMEGVGTTRARAEEALVQTLRSWLERQDTAGKLAEALGVVDLDDDTEIVLQFLTDGDGRAEET